jgi:ketosteroid isomerase-like protein
MEEDLALRGREEMETTENELIQNLAVSYAKGFASNRVEAILDCLTEDFVAITPDKPPVEGKSTVKTAIERDLSEMEILDLNFKPDEIVTHSDWGFARGSSSGSIRMKTGDQVIQLKGKFLWILRKGEDGRWRVARDSAFGDQ